MVYCNTMQTCLKAATQCSYMKAGGGDPPPFIPTTLTICPSGLRHRHCTRGVQGCAVVLVVGSLVTWLLLPRETERNLTQEGTGDKGYCWLVASHPFAEQWLPAATAFITGWKPETGTFCLEWGQAPHLLFPISFLWPQTRIASRSTCRCGSDWSLWTSWEIALRRWWHCVHRVGAAGGARGPAAPGWVRATSCCFEDWMAASAIRCIWPSFLLEYCGWVCLS